ncbi:MAG TPA: twin-arginine translocase TatA/TatE family subunit [Methylocella sp.]
MFDFDAGKFIIIGVVALIVIGPKELPRVMRQVGQAAAKMRRMAAEFRGQFMDAMREADIEDFKADAVKLAESAKIAVGVDRLADVKEELTRVLDAAGKPATPPVADTPAAAAPHNAEPNALPALPQAPEEGGESAIATAAPRQAPPAAAATDAEMRALADALAAEMGDAQARRDVDGARPQGKG